MQNWEMYLEKQLKNKNVSLVVDTQQKKGKWKKRKVTKLPNQIHFGYVVFGTSILELN